VSERIKFHLDENVSSAIADGLRRRGIDVTTTAEVGLIGASDETQLAFAHQSGVCCLRWMMTSCDYTLRENRTQALVIANRERGLLAKCCGRWWSSMKP